MAPEFDVGRCCFIGVVVIAGMPKASEAAPAGTAPLTYGPLVQTNVKRAFPPHYGDSVIWHQRLPRLCLKNNDFLPGTGKAD